MTLLEISQNLGRLVHPLKSLLTTSTFRYHLIVASSDRGPDCPHAQMAARYSEDETDMVRSQLLEMRKLIDEALGSTNE